MLEGDGVGVKKDAAVGLAGLCVRGLPERSRPAGSGVGWPVERAGTIVALLLLGFCSSDLYGGKDDDADGGGAGNGGCEAVLVLGGGVYHLL